MIDNKYPAVSVIINTHGGMENASLLKRAIASVQLQEFTEAWEVLVVYDGQPSVEFTESLREVLDEEGHEDGDLLPLSNGKTVPFTFFGAGDEPSGYQCYPKNQAIGLARGEFICFLDGDNEFTEGRLQVLWDALHEGTVWPDFTYGQRKYLVDEECDSKIELPGGETMELSEKVSPALDFTSENLQQLASSPMCNFLDTSDFMIAKGALWRMYLATGMIWNEDKRRFADWELMARGIFFAGWRGKMIEYVVQNYHWTGANLQLIRSPNEVPEKRAL